MPPAEAPSRWEHFRHGADIGLRGRGPTLAQAFEQAARALTAVLTDPTRVAATLSLDFACEAPDPELLLVDFLNALVYRMATRGLLFARVEVLEVQMDAVGHESGGARLTARAWGEALDVARHQPAVEVKGATHAELVVAQQPDGSWLAQCVVDV